ncbi:DNA-(apurinic or apyrimidinic site) lyase /endonuclease III [Malonomonas rubra DSM 5091]|uniref:Endonuclease III n=1 Tax=Malonomonas rubra DSM 5091 TaxID=1122189 RepID=A0A1M6JTF7_MALRU|nr:endonuclease III [Malonomonas rubra]SHJ49936.1 DNA-(apurinic or apyrimidinic site) lyase /endonuclease III [Malonomonas rubra DSM 5091]
MKKKDRALYLYHQLEQAYPGARCGLDYQNAWQLLVATILSAQCTDKRVNLVTVDLFASLPGPKEMASATQEQVESLIRTTGFFRNKAKNLIQCAEQVLSKHQGEVPRTMPELVDLAGVGRKTANVVLGNAFDVPGMVVDTHVKRLSRRFGWTKSDNPVQIEKELSKLLPPEVWTQAGHVMIAHGRACCKAPIPVCSQCPVLELCPRKTVDRAR